MNLKPRFLLLTCILIFLVGAGVWVAGHKIILNIVEEWSARHFATQVRLEEERSLQPLIREVALARQFADSQILREWIKDPLNKGKKQRALNEMEAFRQNFADHSYFVALLDSGDYYHNNAADEFAGEEYRYTLKEDNPDDSWFYSIVAQNRDIHLNVNPDVQLGVTKLWIDVLMRDGDQVIGVVGTGLDLSRYISDIATSPDPGINNFLFDHEGAIQISHDLSQIDYNSISKEQSEQKTVWQLLDTEQDQQVLRQAMANAQDNPGQVSSLYLSHDGHEYLSGVIYLPEIDWYVMTLQDLDQLVPLATFHELLLLAGVTLVVFLLLFNLAFNRHILRPISNLEGAIRELRETGSITPLHEPDSGETGRLIRHFNSMAEDITRHHEELESRVKQRTRELELLTQTDPLTGLLNRRGMLQHLTRHMNRLEREKEHFGILWIDLDHFKAINDEYGHAMGDHALETTADKIRTDLRLYDYAARWGGDEFLVLIKAPDKETLDQLGQRLCKTLCAVKLTAAENSGPAPDNTRLSVSIGGCFVNQGGSLNGVLAAADQALYMAKNAGRGHYVSTQLHT
tara:strand:+ start:28861 stop:30576 length:1716 start_codon:yes stop_codon:yes gene_type:complete